MPDTPKRRWFQIHLSTAIVMMFVASGLLYLNLSGSMNIIGTHPLGRIGIIDQGWPATANVSIGFVIDKTELKNYEASISLWKQQNRVRQFGDYIFVKLDDAMGNGRFIVSGALIDIAVAILALAISTCFSEHLIRRKISP